MSTTTIAIIETITDCKYVIKCACCKGTGRMSRDHDNSSPYVVCKVCDGRGLVLVETTEPVPLAACGLCNGRGEQSRDLDNRAPYIICTKCKGVGARPIAGGMEIIK